MTKQNTAPASSQEGNTNRFNLLLRGARGVFQSTLLKSVKRNLILLFVLLTLTSKATYLFIPMDDSQKNHLKAYGISFYALEKTLEVDWLLNYRGGSFALKLNDDVLKESSKISRHKVHYILASYITASSISKENITRIDKY